MTLMRFRTGTPAFYSAFQFGERRGGLIIADPIYINSGYTRMMGSGEWEWGVGECRIIDLDFIIPMQPETILHRMFFRIIWSYRN